MIRCDVCFKGSDVIEVANAMKLLAAVIERCGISNGYGHFGSPCDYEYDCIEVPDTETKRIITDDILQ